MKYAVFAIVLCSATVLAQDVAAPTLTDDQKVRIQNIELRAEVLTLRIAAAQAELAKLQGEATTYFASLKRDGYSVTRQPDGSWAYVLDVPPAKQ